MKILKLIFISVFCFVATEISSAATRMPSKGKMPTPLLTRPPHGAPTKKERDVLARAKHQAGVEKRRADLAQKKRQSNKSLAATIVAQPEASVEWLQSTYTNMTKNLFVLIFLGTKINLSDEGEWESWNYLWRDLPVDKDPLDKSPYFFSPQAQALFQEDWVIHAMKESRSTIQNISKLSSEELLIKLFNLMHGISTVASSLAMPSEKDFALFDQATNIYGLDRRQFSPEIYQTIKDTQAKHLIARRSTFFKKYGLLLFSRINKVLKCPIDRISRKLLEIQEIERGISKFNLQQARHAEIYKDFLYLPEEVNRMRDIIIQFAQATNELVAKAFRFTAEIIVNDIIATVKNGSSGKRIRSIYDQPVIQNHRFIRKCTISFGDPESSMDTQKILPIIETQAKPITKEKICELRLRGISPLANTGEEPMLKLLEKIRSLF